MPRITANDLQNWAQARSRDCQERLPELVRRLVRASCPKAARVDFPAGDSVVIGGWDGLVDTPEAGINVSAGGSGWELGTDRDIKGKADDEYGKRAQAPGELNPAESTFVFVTPRRWRNKRTWERDRKAESAWRDVRALDAEDLEQWIEQCPSVELWLGSHLRLPGADHQALEQFWDEWSSASDPALPAALVTAGRDEARATLLSWLDTESGVLTVAGDTEEESAAFVYAALAEAPDGAGQRHLDRAIMLTPGGDVARLVEVKTPMLLVAVDLELLKKHAGRAAARGHHVIVATARRVGMQSEVLDLPRVPRTVFREVLQSAGLGEEETEALAWATGRSIPVLRRRKARGPELYRPVWADAAGVRDILPLLLSGGWNERNEHDRAAVASLADRPYGEVELAVAGLANQPDPPVRKIGDVWRLIAPVDAFFLVAGGVQRNDLDRLRQVALDVLSHTDPALNLPPEERHYASIRGQVLEHSAHIRHGLVQGLKLIGVYGERVLADFDGRSFAERVIRDLLQEASGQRWCTLEALLPDLAEAGPDALLAAIEHSLASTPSPIMMMFEEEEGMIGGVSRHSGLLWSLEGLAWHPDYLSRVSLILANLARLDPGGRLDNRPLRSLRHLFLPWLIQTTADTRRRQEALDLIVEREPTTAWKLLLEIGPAHHDSASHLHKPSALWRDELSLVVRRATFEEHFGAIESNVRRLLQLVGTDVARWVDSLEPSPWFSPQHRDEFLTRLRAHAEANTLDGERRDLRNALRDVLDRHRRVEGRADWALPRADADRLEEIYTLLEPRDPIERNRHLFDSHWPTLAEGKGPDYREHAQIIQRARDAALREVVAADGAEGIVRLAITAELPPLVGQTAEQLGLDDGEERALLDHALQIEQDWAASFVRGFLISRTHREGWATAETVLARAREESWDRNRLLRLVFSLPESPRLWDEVEALGDDVHQRYWSKVRGLFVRGADDARRAVDELLRVGRPLEAYATARLLLRELPGLAVARLLDAVATAGDSAEQSHRLQSHEIEEAFKAIEASHDVPKDLVVRLEWAFFEFLEHTERQPRELYRALAEDPAMFVTLLRWAFRPKNTARPGAGEEAVPPQKARRAYRVLDSWNTIPGLVDGRIDPANLAEWVERAREQSKEVDRLEICDDRIGHMLALSSVGENGGSSIGEEGAWPPESVRDIIDRIASEALDDGFRVGLYNARGAVWRGPGGQQERELAERYRRWAGQIAGRWPRTGALLRRIAQIYEREGRLWDIDDELRDLD